MSEFKFWRNYLGVAHAEGIDAVNMQSQVRGEVPYVKSVDLDLEGYSDYMQETPDYMKGMTEDEYADWQKSWRTRLTPEGRAGMPGAD